MSQLTNAANAVSEALHNLQTAFNVLVTEIGISDSASRQTRADLEAAGARETELRGLLREKGLASFEEAEK